MPTLTSARAAHTVMRTAIDRQFQNDEEGRGNISSGNDYGEILSLWIILQG